MSLSNLITIFITIILICSCNCAKLKHIQLRFKYTILILLNDNGKLIIPLFYCLIKTKAEINDE